MTIFYYVAFMDLIGLQWSRKKERKETKWKATVFHNRVQILKTADELTIQSLWVHGSIILKTASRTVPSFLHCYKHIVLIS
jgi:hypothetical protein